MHKMMFVVVEVGSDGIDLELSFGGFAWLVG